MAKSANLYARIEPEVKEQAEAILSALGIPASNAITMFYKQVILQRAVEENLGRGMGETLAEETALRTIAKPGHSEHHTGLAVDLNDVSDDFEETQAYRWLQAHAAEYGFIQRYRTDKSHITGIDNESWHYRYVGREHALAMERLDLCLEEYVAYLRERGMP